MEEHLSYYTLTTVFSKSNRMALKTGTTNQHAQESFDEGVSSDNSEEDFRRGKL